MSYLIENARRAGPMRALSYRVVVDQGGRLSVRDFDDLDEACAYADDAVGEHGDAPNLAIVVDANLKVVHQGRPYFLP